MLRRLYDWTLHLAETPRATYALGVVSFTESSFFPVPPDALMIPMIIARRHSAWRLAFICTVTSVLGAMFGYLIGALFFDQVAKPILDFYGYGEKFEHFAALYNHWGAWILIIVSLTPLPFKVAAIASGATGLGFPIFILGSIVARGIRFYTVAALLYWFGPSVRDFIEKRLILVFSVGVIAVVAGFAALKLLI